MSKCRSRRCFKEPEAEALSRKLSAPFHAAVAAVSKSLRRGFQQGELPARHRAAVAAVSKSLRRNDQLASFLKGITPQSPLFQRA